MPAPLYNFGNAMGRNAMGAGQPGGWGQPQGGVYQNPQLVMGGGGRSPGQMSGPLGQASSGGWGQPQNGVLPNPMLTMGGQQARPQFQTPGQAGVGMSAPPQFSPQGYGPSNGGMFGRQGPLGMPPQQPQFNPQGQATRQPMPGGLHRMF